MATTIRKDSVTLHIHKTTNNTIAMMGKMNFKRPTPTQFGKIHNSMSGLEKSRPTSRFTMSTLRSTWTNLQDQLRQSTSRAFRMSTPTRPSMAMLTHCYTAVWLTCTIQSVETMRDSSPRHLTMDSVLLKCHLTLLFRFDW
eukprot:4962636-Amphidinium_carterae.2